MVASRESQYKVFHFHHGGLDKLSDVFQRWKYCAETQLKDQVAGVREAEGRCLGGGVWRGPSPGSTHPPLPDPPPALQAYPGGPGLPPPTEASPGAGRDRDPAPPTPGGGWSLGVLAGQDAGSLGSQCSALEKPCFDKISCRILLNLHTNVIRTL